MIMIYLLINIICICIIMLYLIYNKYFKQLKMQQRVNSDVTINHAWRKKLNSNF